MSAAFTIKTEQFEGPIDLLLDLIEKQKLHINDVSLARVADDYIAHVQALPEMPVGDTANFILVASILILIKSLSLLPSLPVTTEEQASIEELQRRLKLHQEMKEKGEHVKALWGVRIMFEREPDKERPVVFSPSKDLTLENLMAGISSVIANLPKKEKMPEAVVQKVVSIEEMMDSLTTRIQNSLKMSFKDFSGLGKADRVTVVVSFLAMLELVKQGAILVRQQGNFDDIEIETDVVAVPRYN